MTSRDQDSGKMDRDSKFSLTRLVHSYTDLNWISIGFKFIFKRNTRFDVTFKDKKRLSNINLSQLAWLCKLIDSGWRISSLEGSFLILNNKDGISITCRIDKGFDFGHLNEIFLKGVYGSDFNNKNIIDIGMSNGDSALYFANRGAKKVVGVEPFFESFNLAARSIRISGLESRIIILNKAVTAKGDPVTLWVYSKNPNASSIESENMVKLRDSKSTELVGGVNLRELINLFEGDAIDFLKMDCEGCEYDVLQSLDENSFQLIKEILVEYHNGQQNLVELFRRMGYEPLLKEVTSGMGYIRAKRN